jgi:hypothetical protein
VTVPATLIHSHSRWVEPPVNTAQNKAQGELAVAVIEINHPRDSMTPFLALTISYIAHHRNNTGNRPVPEINPSFVAIGIAVVVTFFLGYVWYSVIFAKAWAREMGFDPNRKENGAQLAKGLALNIIALFFMVFVLSQNMAVWNPKTWGVANAEMSGWSQSLAAAFFTWLGFIVPVLLSGVAWERKSWKLFAINGGYYFIVLLIAALLIAHL